MKKILSLLLIAIMIISVFAACDKTSNEDTSDTLTSATTEATVDDTTEAISDLIAESTESDVATDAQSFEQTSAATEADSTVETDETSDSAESTATESTDTESTDTESTDTESTTPSATTKITINGNPIELYTIVYYDSYFGNQTANFIKTVIRDKTGIELKTSADAAAESDYEILVGKTNRQASVDIRATFSHPNVYYATKVVGNKLVIMGEGYRTLSAVRTLFRNYLSTLVDNSNITGEINGGQVMAKFDADRNMLTTASGTDLRVLHWNLMAPYGSNENAIYTNWAQRIEIMADTILAYNPDIFTTNEMYPLNYSDRQYQLLKKELSTYYYIIDTSPYDKNKPVNGFDAVEGLSINEQIFVRKGKDIEVEVSGWRYFSNRDSEGGGTYQGLHWAVLTMGEKKFIVSVAHYGDSRTSNMYATEHLNAIRDAQAASGSETTLPTIVTGDMYSWINHSDGSAGSGYYTWQNNGFFDSQTTAKMNANKNLLHGTFHDIGVVETTRAAEDFIWYNSGLEALKFKVLVDTEITNSSDHYPVCADLKFK